MTNLLKQLSILAIAATGLAATAIAAGTLAWLVEDGTDGIYR